MSAINQLEQRRRDKRLRDYPTQGKAHIYAPSNLRLQCAFCQNEAQRIGENRFSEALVALCSGCGRDERVSRSIPMHSKELALMVAVTASHSYVGAMPGAEELYTAAFTELRALFEYEAKNPVE